MRVFNMTTFKFFFSACVLLVSLLEIQALAQRERIAGAKSSQAKQCPNPSGRKVWIKVAGETELLDGVFLEFDEEYIYYCEGRRLNSAAMIEVKEIYFDSKPSAAVKTVSTTGNNPLPQPDGVTPIKARIKSPLRFPHKTKSGMVKLLVELRENSSVGKVTVLEGADPVLAELAKSLAKTLDFTPEIRKGTFVTTEQEITLTFLADASKPAEKGAVLPEPIGPKGYEAVPRSKAQLSWKPVPGAVAYKLKIEYSPDGGNNWEKYLEKSISSQLTTYDLPYLGTGAVKWLVEAERDDGKEFEGWWAFFAYGKK